MIFRLKPSSLPATCYLLPTLICLLLLGCAGQRLHSDNRVMMGTFVEVVSPDKRAPDIVFAEIKRVEGLLSKYDPESEISKLNRDGKVIAGPDTLFVLKKAREFWKESGGAFDVTVGPLAGLWGFTDKKYRLPQEAEIKKTLELVGSEKILFDNSDNVVKLKLPGMQVDLGGIAKGYALDCCAQKLKENGIRSCLINLGGQVYCLGDRSGKPWYIAIQPARGNTAPRPPLELKDQGAATSGDYQQFFTIDNKQYCHIFDPKSGYPADSGIKSVTVVANNNLDADALATAIFVLGKDKGEALAGKYPGVEVEIDEERQ